MSRLYESSVDYEEHVTYAGIIFDDGTTPVNNPSGYRSTVTTYGDPVAVYTSSHVTETATGSGTGSGTASFFIGHHRQGTGSGTGSSSNVTRFINHHRQGTGSGQGSDTPATWTRLFLFRTPTDLEVDFTGAYRVQLVTQRQRPAFNLYRFYDPGPRGRNVFKLTDGSYTENQPPEDDDIDIVYYGGHNHYVDDVEKSELVGAGYGAYVN